MQPRPEQLGIRIAVIGCAGSGKSTLAAKLGSSTGLPVIHLDQLFWKPGWVPTPPEDWARVNREIVELIQRGGGQAIGLTGNDGRMLLVRRREGLGRVGEVVAVDPAPIKAASEAGFIPVIAPIGVDAHGTTHNVNADEAAGAIARALQAEKFILLTDVEGVRDASGRLLGQLSELDAKKLIAEATIQGGMIPKVECCLDALRGGVACAHIVDGRILHAILLEIFTDRGVGTLLTMRPSRAAPRGKATSRAAGS